MPKSPRKSGSKPGRALARPGDPLVGYDGEVIQPDNTAKEHTLKRTVKPEEFRPQKKRSTKELPGDVRTVNAVAVVFMYTCLGLGDREIADLLGVDTTEIADIRRNQAYSECFQAVHSEFINANSDILASRIAGYAENALETVGELVVSGKKEETRLRASIDIMDRAGLRPKDQEQRQVVQKSELRITIVEATKERTSFNVEVGE